MTPFRKALFFRGFLQKRCPGAAAALVFLRLILYNNFVKRLTADGQVRAAKYLDYTFNIDERIVDGFYYAEALKYFHRLLRDPSRLDTPPENVIRDID